MAYILVGHRNFTWLHYAFRRQCPTSSVESQMWRPNAQPAEAPPLISKWFAVIDPDDLAS
jgi:hypothetical protein